MKKVFALLFLSVIIMIALLGCKSQVSDTVDLTDETETSSQRSEQKNEENDFLLSKETCFFANGEIDSIVEYNYDNTGRIVLKKIMSKVPLSDDSIQTHEYIYKNKTDIDYINITISSDVSDTVSTGVETYEYFSDGTCESITYDENENISEIRTFDKNNRLTKKTMYLDKWELVNTYYYCDNGEYESIVENRYKDGEHQGTYSEEFTYEYNSEGKVYKQTCKSSNGNGNHYALFSYDLNGNKSSYKEYDSTGKINKIIEYEYVSKKELAKIENIDNTQTTLGTTQPITDSHDVANQIKDNPDYTDFYSGCKGYWVALDNMRDMYDGTKSFDFVCFEDEKIIMGTYPGEGSVANIIGFEKKSDYEYELVLYYPESYDYDEYVEAETKKTKITFTNRTLFFDFEPNTEFWYVADSFESTLSAIKNNNY